MAGDGNRAGRRHRRDDLRAERVRRGDESLAVGTGQHDAGLVGDCQQLFLGATAVFADFGVAARGHERGTHADSRTGAQQVGVASHRGADDDELGGADWNLVDRGAGRNAEDLGAVAAGGVDRALVAADEQVVQRHAAEAPGVGRSACDDHTAGLKEGA